MSNTCPRCSHQMKPLFISMYCPNCDNNSNKTYYGYIPVWSHNFRSNFFTHKTSIYSVVVSSKELTQKFLLNQYPRNKAEDFLILKVSSSNPITYSDNIVEDIKYGDVVGNKYKVSVDDPKNEKELKFVSYE
ncbi:MAG: hypothetical protein RL621_1849 [Bacteroidota bacterium]